MCGQKQDSKKHTQDAKAFPTPNTSQGYFLHWNSIPGSARPHSKPLLLSVALTKT